MTKFKENTGRRLLVIAGVVFACVLTTLCFSNANADSPHSDPDNMTSIDKVWIGSNVNAPVDDSFDIEFKCTAAAVTGDASIRVPDKNIFKNSTFKMDASADNGNFNQGYQYDSTGATEKFVKKVGYQDINGNDLNTNANTPNTIAGYIHSTQLTNLLDPNFDPSNCTAYFPRAGHYQYKVTVESKTNCHSADTHTFEASTDRYYINIFITTKDGGRNEVHSTYVTQDQTIRSSWIGIKKKYVEKPALQVNESWEEDSTNPAYPDKKYQTWSGFVFVALHNCGENNTNLQDLIMGQYVTGILGDETKEFVFPQGTFTLYSDDFNYSIYGSNKVYADKVKIDASGNYLGDLDASFEFTVTPATEKKNGITVVPGTLKNAQAIKLKSYEAVRFVDENGLPISTYYTAKEQGAEQYNPMFYGSTWSMNEVAKKNGTVSQDLVGSYKALDKTNGFEQLKVTERQVGFRASSNREISEGNKLIFVNECVDTPTGFMIDVIPYLVLIGIPLVAFAAWMISRKKKLNL